MLAQFCFIGLFLSRIHGTIWDEIKGVNDLSEFRRICAENSECQSYLDDEDEQVTIFAPVDDVFNRYPKLASMEKPLILSYIVDMQVPEIALGRKWDNGLLLARNILTSGRVYILQAEHNPGNFSYFANNGRLCNHVSTSWVLVSANQTLYKICQWYGHEPFPGSALDLIKANPDEFQSRNYSNTQLVRLQDQLLYFPVEAMVVFGFASNITFFLPNNEAFEKNPSLRNSINREVLLAHVTMPNVVLFVESWLYDYGIHKYSTLRFDTNVLMENDKLKLSIRNITDRDTGRWELFVMSSVHERYSTFKRGAVWARIVEPNIPVQNGAVHIIDTILGVVTQSMEQLLYNDYRFVKLTDALNQIGELKSWLGAQHRLFTFFAPMNEAWNRIPQDVRDRLFQDKFWLLSVLRMHIVPDTELTSDQLNNFTVANTENDKQRLYFIKGEWPKNNITYCVIGGGVRAMIRQEDVAATNGIIHYIDRVLGVPYENMFEILRYESSLQTTFNGIYNTTLRYSLDPWKVERDEENFTFFVPTDEAWMKVSPELKRRFFDGSNSHALQFVFTRHILEGQALMLQDLRPRTYVMMNNQQVEVLRNGSNWQLYWPYGGITANIIEAGEIAATNGYMHMIDNVFILEEDLDGAGATQNVSDSFSEILNNSETGEAYINNTEPNVINDTAF